MSYTLVSSTERSFFTREKGILFTIRIREELTQENVEEVKKRANRLPHDFIVLRNGIEIRESFSEQQNQEVLNQLADVTKQDVEYCFEHDLIHLSRHVLVDYLEEKPEVLVNRGWSCDHDELMNEVTRSLIQANQVEKATIHLLVSGIDRKPLTYTIIGEDGENRRRVCISILHQSLHRSPSVKIVTVLHPNER